MSHHQHKTVWAAGCDTWLLIKLIKVCFFLFCSFLIFSFSFLIFSFSFLQHKTRLSSSGKPEEVRVKLKAAQDSQAAVSSRVPAAVHWHSDDITLLQSTSQQTQAPHSCSSFECPAISCWSTSVTQQQVAAVCRIRQNPIFVHMELWTQRAELPVLGEVAALPPCAYGLREATANPCGVVESRRTHSQRSRARR